jgi:hypothetical protein
MAANGIDGYIEPVAAAPDLPTEAELAAAQTAMERLRALFPFDLKLTYPIQAHGETTSALTLQVPRLGEVFHSGGNPFVDGPGKPADLRRLIPLISRMAAIPESSVKQLAMPDVAAIELLLTPLFAPSAASLKPILSTLRTSSTISAP